MEEKSSTEKSHNPSDNALENFEPNVLGVFSYLFPPITGIIFFLIEKNNKFVKFHAFQSILFGISGYVIWKVVQFSKIILIGNILDPLVSVGLFLVWIMLMWKAYNKEEYELPYIGKMAKEQVNK